MIADCGWTDCLTLPAQADPCANAAEHWKSTEAVGSAAAFEDHLARFPNCAYAGLARARIDDLKSKDRTKKSEVEIAFWNSIKDGSDTTGFKDYLTRFPDGAFTTLARDRLAALTAPQAAVTPPSAPATGVEAPADASCASEPKLKSQAGNRPVTMTFKNVSREALSAYWLDYAGKRVFYRRLGSGDSYVQPTYMTHPWVFVDASGKCRTVVLPDPARSTVSVR